jgi:hypothetical protein
MRMDPFAREGGYFMSQDQEDAVVGRLVRERTAHKQKLVKLKEEAIRLGRNLEALGRDLQDDGKRWNIAVDAYKSLLSESTAENISKLKTEIRDTELESSRLDGRLRELGIKD